MTAAVMCCLVSYLALNTCATQVARTRLAPTTRCACAPPVCAMRGAPYVIPLGLDNPPLGAFGYVDAAREVLDQGP